MSTPRAICLPFHDAKFDLLPRLPPSLVTHFVVPWTRGTGTSIALLLSQEEHDEAEITLSRTWAGPSVADTHFKLKKLADGKDASVPAKTRVFFSAVCLNYAEDKTPSEMSIDAQLDLVLSSLLSRQARFIEVK